MNRTCEIHDTILQDDLKLRERPLKVLAAVDSFKGSMTSVQAGMAVKKGLEKNYKNCEIEVVPVADGGGNHGCDRLWEIEHETSYS